MQLHLPANNDNFSSNVSGRSSNVSARSTSSRESSLQRNKKPLSYYLKKYNARFTKSIDGMWEEHDRDGNGYLDRDEAKTFLEELSKVISEDRAKFYNPE